ncbi:MAG: flavodoxin-dependent (E)-4-hydroxy-3-methylbut-2-enyl-diphosphate synthase [Clostridiales bacterium]|nr:flavodoxin-dependent (E)-4-hydroxy-3-methylbut-2-enyl-diphosphate synthase [Clostridiales bacterium]MDD6681597.1 flavodoxin-dependent (E)-4-hydroxy-3-methylbut-2-enyl-diphosphate synthase [Clostridiales bacterium]
MKRQVFAGSVPIGGGSPVTIQSMTNTDTRDVPATLEQIKLLAMAGCDLVRISVYDRACAGAVRALVDQSPVPLIADIHFDHTLAIAAMENGIHKLRINPGNIGSAEKVRRVVDCAKAHHVPIRIGVNAGSLEKDIVEKEGGATAKGMVESALRHIRLLEAEGFYDIVLSLKASDVPLTVKAYQLMHQVCDYPLHLGVTEAGLPGQGTVKSAIGIGSLLLDKIGDTIRVSLTGDPVHEPGAALSILRALGLRSGIRFVSCPTCGRTQINVAAIAHRLEEEFAGVDKPVTVAVMGCVVNGPGEARDADIALCGGKDCGALYIGGKHVGKLTGDLAEGMVRAVREYLNDI